MRNLLVAALATIIVVSPAHAQNCQSTAVGDLVFTQCDDGSYSRTQRIGRDLTFIEGVDVAEQPARSTAERIGRWTFYSDH